MNTDTLFLTPVYFPLLSAASLMVTKALGGERGRRVIQTLGGFIALGVPAIALALLSRFVLRQGRMETVIGAWDSSFGIPYHFDGLSYLLIALHLAISIPSWLYRKKGKTHSETFAIFFFIQCSSVAATSLTADLFNLFVCLEVMGTTSYILIASHDLENAILASYMYLLFSATAMVFFLIGMFGLYRITESLSYTAIMLTKNSLQGMDLLVAQISLVLIVISTLLRSAIIPLFGWLFGAHSNAPYPVFALLCGVSLFALIRLLLLVAGSDRIGKPLAWAGDISAILGIPLALREQQAKRLVAYSSIIQIGYVVTAFGLAVRKGIGTEKGILILSLAMIYAFCHALAKALLFLPVGTAADALVTKNLHLAQGANRALQTQGEKLLLTCISFFIACLFLTVLPPTIGYLGKNTLLSRTKGNLVVQLLTVTLVFTIISYLNLSGIILPAKEEKQLHKDKGIGASMPMAFILLSMMLVGEFFLFGQLQSWVIRRLSFLGSSQIEEPSYSPYANLLKSFITLILAIGLYGLYTSGRATKLLAWIPKTQRTFCDFIFWVWARHCHHGPTDGSLGGRNI